MCDNNQFHKMDYYVDRCTRNNVSYIADQCTAGNLYLWDTYYFNIHGIETNIFSHEFDVDAKLKREYLLSMDYLTYVLTEYKRTGKDKYRKTFENIICQFHEYLKTNGPFYSDLPVYAQTLLFIKALDIFESIPYQNDLFQLLQKYACWLMDDNNHCFDHNHGLFEDLALLHISILFKGKTESIKWQNHAVRRIIQLFETAYYNDFTNNENSITYFNFNNYLYGQVIKFCNYYKINSIKKIETELEKSKEALNIFAHKDTSFPVIGDGNIFNSTGSNGHSGLFPDLGMAIIKVGDAYLSFKCKTVFQPHAHADLSSITARYKNIDILIDSGQYNYDRYSPINRYLRSSAGHSGIYPIMADGLFQKNFCSSIRNSGISVYEHYGDNARVKGEYQLEDLIVSREILITQDGLIVKDCWIGQKPRAMRQRFVIPKELIEHSRFTASQRTLESKIGSLKFKYEIISDLENALTSVNFGVVSLQYHNYETAMLLDTITESNLSGKITAKISFWEEQP